MRGYHFNHIELGRGGIDGYTHTIDRWCVEVDGNKYHIIREVLSKEEIYVQLCDGRSCDLLEDIPDRISEIAEAIILKKDFSKRNVGF